MQPIQYVIGPSKLGNKYIYSETDKLGEGAFASVYKGKQDITQEVVAMKIIKNYQQKLKKDQNLKKTLNSEIETQLLLRNKHIVDLLDYIEDSRNIYIIQEYCDGGTLDKVLKERKQIDELEAKMIFMDLLEACWELYDKQIIHRDLKPDNILISQGVYKIADFGFADKMEKQTCSNMGTPLYMSPQQLNNQPTKKSDIWSLGIIYYQLLYGYQTTPWGHLNTFKDSNDFKLKQMNNP
ncbi:Protein kinase-like domain [Pseudocohnilembus persalinus]|uniref:Protein kinase-like domain n=1 Tax=Pseudocohnilembus persalinus TaxID=266149 RepID=A0A0V0R3G5_PSEPJ|nr:Protein kinase-like domain [Pseudocohnilembus persalinus]|eukprot:KRX09005.1 Protein kinase-like domain [Pseudocohnilembus persalinus]